MTHDLHHLQTVDSAQLGKLLGRDRNWVHQALHKKLLPKPMRIGRALRWRISEIERWMRDMEEIGVEE